MHLETLLQFVEETHYINDAYKKKLNPLQLGYHVEVLQNNYEALQNASVCIIGCGDNRGAVNEVSYVHSADLVREELYKSYYWHKNVQLADVGNIVQGKTMEDTKAALQEVISILKEQGKIVVVIGGSHDLTMAQYNVYKAKETLIDVTIADMLIDLAESEAVTDKSYLYDLLTQTPNYVRNLSLLGFQSYYANPKMVDTLSKLHFDCYRLGRLRDDIDDVEPILRKTNIFSIDINVVKHSDAPANQLGSPNGLHGDEICYLTKFAGMGASCDSLGIYGFNPDFDEKGLTAKLIANMIWYFIDGVHNRLNEVDLDDNQGFINFHVNLSGRLVLFKKSKITARWWIELPNKKLLPCTYADYKLASTNEIPERWLREVEKN